MKNKTLHREYISTFFRGNKPAYCAMLLTSSLLADEVTAALDAQTA